jgi:hypothetical protein
MESGSGIKKGRLLLHPSNPASWSCDVNVNVGGGGLLASTWAEKHYAIYLLKKSHKLKT